MSQVSPLDRVIRRVDSDFTARESSEKIVIIDAKHRSIVAKKPLFGFGDLRYYLLLTSGDAFNVAKGAINGFQLQDLNYALPVSVEYDVRCRPGNELRVALALFDGAAGPAEVLERSLMRWLVELGQQSIPEFVRTYVEEPGSLESRISSKALGEAGLDLNVRLTLDYAGSLNPITVLKDHLRTTVSDYHDEEQDLSIRITLEVDEPRKVNAILQYRRNQQLQEIVPREVLRFMRELVTMQEFCTELSSAGLRSRLAQHLDSVLAPFGRKTGAMTLDAPPSPLEFFAQKHHDVECDLPPYPQRVAISNEVQMSLKNVALFKAAKGLDLDQWLREKLTRIVRERLFGAKYINVLIDFEPFEADIKQRLSAEAGAIGYEVKQLITVPDLEPIHLKEPFTIEAAGTFDLKLPNFPVGVQVIVNTRILDLHSVKDQLNRLQYVPDLMEDAVLAAVRGVLHGVVPERFYMRFGFTELAEEKAVEQELVEKVTARLKEKFGAEVNEVIIKVDDNVVITRLRDLQKEITPFAVKVVPVNQGETITFRGNFQVDMVHEDGWSRFQQLPVGVDVIREKLEEHLCAKLQALQPEMIQFRDPNQQKKFTQTLTELAMRYVCGEFGLVVRISNIRRERTAQEEQANQSYINERRVTLQSYEEKLNVWQTANRAGRAELLNRLNQLLAERTALATMGSPEELEELDKKIAEIEKQLAPKKLPAIEQVQTALLPHTAVSVTLDDFAALENLSVHSHVQPKLSEGDPE